MAHGLSDGDVEHQIIHTEVPEEANVIKSLPAARNNHGAIAERMLPERRKAEQGVQHRSAAG